MTAPRVIRDVPCLACGAKPGDWCTQPTENGRREVFWSHLDRENAYREELTDNMPKLIKAVRAALPAHDLFDPSMTLTPAVRDLLAALDRKYNTLEGDSK